MGCSSKITDDEILALLFAIAPQFATTDPVKIASYKVIIDSLRCMINEQALGCCAVLAFANLLAHYLTLTLNPNLGVTTSLSEGQLSIGLASTVGNGDFYNSTSYGQAYQQLIGRFKLGMYVTNAGRGFNGVSCCGSGYGFGFY